jgi:hypothetical protein
MFIQPDRKFAFKLARFFLLYFVISLIISWFIKEDGKAFISFSNLSNKVVLASFMAIIFAVFDKEKAAKSESHSIFSKAHLRQIFFGIAIFLLISLPLFIILYFIFSNFTIEKINLLEELIKLGVFAIVAAVLFSTFIWFAGVLRLRRRRKDQDLGGF